MYILYITDIKNVVILNKDGEVIFVEEMKLHDAFTALKKFGTYFKYDSEQFIFCCKIDDGIDPLGIFPVT